VIPIVEDVTEQSRLEGELIRMEKLAPVGEMVITVNHEINNPLVIISTNAQSLQLMNKELDDNSKKKLERIENQVHGSPTSLSVSGRWRRSLRASISQTGQPW